jgi:hypothetical protein
MGTEEEEVLISHRDRRGREEQDLGGWKEGRDG